MKAKYLTFIATAIALTTANSTTVVAQSSNSKPAEIKLTPPAMKILCDEFPYNSRCPGGASKASTSTDSTMTPPSSTPSSTSPSSGTNEPSSSSPTVPGTTAPIQGAPPGAGSQTRPYVTPQ